jgi:hypothetical protein
MACWGAFHCTSRPVSSRWLLAAALCSKVGSATAQQQQHYQQQYIIIT